MRIALINPNRLHKPPVIPLGLEYLADAIRKAGHEVALLDLCFVHDIPAGIDRFLEDFRPEASFLSIRNVDAVIDVENRFFLNEHQAIARRLTTSGIPLITGGAGLIAMPQQIADQLGAVAAVTGPGEGAAGWIVERLASGKPLPKVIDGFRFCFDRDSIPVRGVDIDYAAYYAAGGIAGFTSSYGCPSACSFCIEARSPLRFRAPAAVAEEVSSLANKGWSRMHLCDAEMNVSYSHALELCLALAGTGIQWMTYMRCTPMDARLAEAMRRSNCEVATVTVNSATDDPEVATTSIRLLKAAGIKVAVDLSCGLPGETREMALTMIKALARACPERVGVTIRFRIYPNTPLAEYIRLNNVERLRTVGDPEFVNPAVYCSFNPEEVREWIVGLEGFELDLGEAVNYQRLG
jgi:radical SAM superfamily enzyme YgiQ (UPF0313 family)